jgi:tetratricopeptide (TPR) repeat protein/predicted Ser/Thr protein kinase
VNVDLPRLWPRVEPILDAVLDLPEPQRSARAQALCGGDPDLAQAVAHVLRAERGSGAFLESAPAELFDLEQEPLADTEIGSSAERIGPFRITAELGRGGMGTVLLGERDDGQFEQKVAIKIFDTNMAPASARETLVRERRILARLEHPHIARIYDGGVTAAADPFFVMEFVDGRPIDEHCDAEHLGRAARLRLFLDVCEAVEYAHRRLVVHCDLKPRNILVTGAGEVKVVDFGIARRIEEEGHGPSPGAGTLLTPAYAAPEQIHGEPLTTATDVYQLGLVLFELLTGRRARSAEPSENLELPSDDDLGADLDAIVRRAVRSEPGERYPSVEALSADVRRYLNDEPVVARAGSFAYRAAKFARRNRGGMAVAGLVLAVLLVAAAGMAWQARETRRQRDRAAEVSSFLVSLFKVSAPSEARGKSVTAREILDQGAARIDKEMAGDPEGQAQLTQTIGTVYYSLGLYSRSEQLYAKALRIDQRILGTEHPVTLDCAMDLANTYWEEGRYPEAEKLHRETLETRRRLFGPEHLDTLRSMASLANTYQSEGRNAEAEKLLQTVLEIQKRVLGPEQVETLRSRNNLAITYLYEGRYPEAEKLYLEAFEIDKRVLGMDDPETFKCIQNLAAVYLRQGRYPEAEEHYLEARGIAERVLGPEHPDTLSVLINLANTYVSEGRLAEAEALSTKTLASLMRVFGPEHPTTLTSRISLANTYQSEGKYKEAEQLLRDTLEIQKRALGPEHPDTLQCRTNLAVAYHSEGRFPEAEKLGEETLRIQKRVLGSEHQDTLLSMLNLAEVYFREGRYAVAEKLNRETIALQKHALGPEHPDTLFTSVNLAVTLSREGRHADAEKLARETLETQRRVLGAENPDTFTCEYQLAGIAVGAGRRGEALEWLRQSIAHGFRDGDSMAEDEGLVSLHGDREFERLLALARTSAAK